MYKMAQSHGHLYRLICPWGFVTLVHVGKTLPIKSGTDIIAWSFFHFFEITVRFAFLENSSSVYNNDVLRKNLQQFLHFLVML